MWNATITSVAKSLGRVEVSVSYTDGASTLTDKYVTTCAQPADWMNSNIKRKLESLATIDAFGDTIPLGAFTVTEDPVVTPDLEKEAFLAKLDEYRHYRRAATEGLILDTNAALVACRVALKALWKPEYLGLI
jgi:hypothetical protein